MNIQQNFKMLPTEEAAKLRGRGPVSSKPYYDPEWWELERKAIFMRSWLHVGHLCEIPDAGSFIRRDIGFARASLLIVRGKDGEVRTFHNACTHRGTQLTQESCGKQSKFSCPYHMWTFGTDGSLLSAPDFERFYVAREDVGLRQVATEVLAGMIFINFDPEPKQSVREFFGPLVDQMETLPVARATSFTEWNYEIEANWKTNFDNFQENYHLRFIHPRTGQQTIGEDNPFGYPTHYGFLGPHRSQTLWSNPDPPPIPPSLLMGYGKAAQLAAKDGVSFEKTDFKLFPCLHIVGLPPAQQFTHTMMPLGPGRTRGQVRMYWTGEADRASRAYTREFGAMTIRDVLSEDRFAVESGQRGLNSGAIEQIHLQDHEMLLRHLYETVQDKVAEYLAEQEAG
ncbi:MAG: aromatic ring-hydroxylating dioxygenase subunit alpha [Novosphingobium sp.]|nr:aromatic ring-hydroxylating dioxygenase subunit alpha [Novosphingobium sp.]